MGATRTTALNELNIRGLATVTGATTTVVPSDSGVYFISAATGTHTFTLPLVAECAGKMFMFINRVNYGMTVQTATDSTSLDKLVAFNNAGADKVKFLTTNELIGGALQILGDGSYYYAFNISAGANTLTASG